MRVIETFLRGKDEDQSRCEDRIVTGSRITAVIDGVTSHGKLRWNGGTSGRFAKDVLCEYILANEDVLVKLPAGECMRRLNSVLAIKCEEAHPGPKAIEEYPRACIILYNSEAGEVWSCGDCHCRIGDEVHCEGKEVDRLLAELRSFVIRSEILRKMAQERSQPERKKPAQKPDLPDGNLLEGKMPAQEPGQFAGQHVGQDVGREAILPLIKRQLWFENTPGPFGYPVLNGLSFAEEMVRVWPVPDGAEVVLTTDGYPEPGASLAESEARLREIIAEDPLCIGVNAGTKGIMDGMESFDDRAYVRVATATGGCR